MKRRLLLAAIIILAWAAFFAWQQRRIDGLTGDAIGSVAEL